MIRLRSRCKSLVTVLGRKRTDVIDVYQPGDCFIHKYSGMLYLLPFTQMLGLHLHVMKYCIHHMYYLHITCITWACKTV